MKVCFAFEKLLIFLVSFFFPFPTPASLVFNQTNTLDQSNLSDIEVGFSWDRTHFWTSKWLWKCCLLDVACSEIFHFGFRVWLTRKSYFQWSWNTVQNWARADGSWSCYFQRRAPGNMSLQLSPHSPLCISLQWVQMGLTAFESFPSFRPSWVSAQVSDLLVMSLMKK